MAKLLPKINISPLSGSPFRSCTKPNNNNFFIMENRKKQLRDLNGDLKRVLPPIPSTKVFRKKVVFSVIGSG